MSVKRNLLSFIETGEAVETAEAVRQRVRDAMAAAQDAQKEQSDRHGRKNTQVFQLGDQVLLNAKNLPTPALSAVGSNKLRPRFVHGHRGPRPRLHAGLAIVHGHTSDVLRRLAQALSPGGGC
ncbi:unnamed protein product [Phytophthora fragariaefolia]|uniref:Unnamed protein product n=1 Tax=Phytophthora fragariaefolia TaxID=1490495 RepID=A0A9W7D7Z1_9STRA|nr:unnamed protein product [Phytophthora fragariaefolia]